MIIIIEMERESKKINGNGKSMVINENQGNLWKSTEIYENQWEEMRIIEINENQRKSMGNQGNQWKSKEINGNWWKSEETIGFKWNIINIIKSNLEKIFSQMWQFSMESRNELFPIAKPIGIRKRNSSRNFLSKLIN